MYGIRSYAHLIFSRHIYHLTKCLDESLSDLICKDLKFLNDDAKLLPGVGFCLLHNTENLINVNKSIEGFLGSYYYAVKKKHSKVFSVL